MLHLNELVGRAVVDLENAEKVGHVDDFILDPEGCRVAGVVVASGQSLLGGGTRTTWDAGAVHSVGPDAITVHSRDGLPDAAAYEHLPRRRDVTGRKVVGQSGRMFGHIRDILVDPGNGRVIGYSMEDNPLGGLENILTGNKPRMSEFLRADADLRVGHDLVVVPDEAVIGVDDPAAATVAPAPGTDGWGSLGARPEPSAWSRHRLVVAAPAATDEPPPPADEEAILYEEMLAPSAEVDTP